jgi:hypothetical protein
MMYISCIYKDLPKIGLALVSFESSLFLCVGQDILKQFRLAWKNGRRQGAGRKDGKIHVKVPTIDGVMIA